LKRTGAAQSSAYSKTSAPQSKRAWESATTNSTFSLTPWPSRQFVLKCLSEHVEYVKRVALRALRKWMKDSRVVRSTKKGTAGKSRSTIPARSVTVVIKGRKDITATDFRD
jgi:hypothetical protein